MTKKNRFVVPILLFFTVNTSAMWAKISDCELIGRSILIVEAEFTGKTTVQISADGQSVKPGVLRVKRVFKGDNTLTEVLIDQPKSLFPSSSSDIFYPKGQKAIWFLKEGKNTAAGIYYVNDPQRFWPEDQAPRLSKLLDNCPDAK